MPALFSEIWMVGRWIDDNTYHVKGFTDTEGSAEAACETEDDFICLIEGGETRVGAPMTGRYPLHPDEEA